MPDDFLHDSHVHSEVQLSYPDRLMNEQYYDLIDNDQPFQQPVSSPQIHHSTQPVPSQKIHPSVQPASSQQSRIQAKNVASVVIQENERRLPEPCPVPYSSFSPDVIQAIEKDQLKGILKIRLIRQAADFYYGLCPNPNHIEYVTMAKTLCERYPQLRDKKPVKGKFVYYVSSHI